MHDGPVLEKPIQDQASLNENFIDVRRNRKNATNLDLSVQKICLNGIGYVEQKPCFLSLSLANIPPTRHQLLSQCSMISQACIPNTNAIYRSILALYVVAIPSGVPP